jgi:large subunit ribosomal protein LP0
LNIASKINRGTVEIINDVVLLKVGDKVGASEAALLQKLNINPFAYALKIRTVYDNGTVFDAAVLDIKDDDLLTRFNNAVKNVAAVSLATGTASFAAVPHLIINGYKNVLALSMATTYEIKATKALKEYLANPSAFAAPKKDDKKGDDKKGDDKKKDDKKGDDKKKEEKKKEPEPAEEPQEEGMFDLFG